MSFSLYRISCCSTLSVWLILCGILPRNPPVYWLFNIAIGIDWATQAKNIGLASGFFEDGRTRIDEVTIGSNDTGPGGTILKWTKQCKSILIALEAPLDWLVELGKALNIHEAGRPIMVEPNQLFHPEADRSIREKIGKQPLDIGSDRIARTAHAALLLLEV